MVNHPDHDRRYLVATFGMWAGSIPVRGARLGIRLGVGIDRNGG